MTEDVISIEQQLEDGRVVATIARDTGLSAASVRAVLARLGELPSPRVWRLCEAAHSNELRQRERMRRKGR